MASPRLRFRFPSPQLPNLPHHSPRSFCKAFVVPAASGSSLAAGVAVSQKPINPIVQNAFVFSNHRSSHFWASASISDESSVSEPKTGVSFPFRLNDSRQLLGTGSWKRECMMQDICVYAFGVYADDGDLKRVLSAKHGSFSVPSWLIFNKGKHLRKHLLGADIRMTVRLQMVYSGTTIDMVREHFEKSVGGRLRDKELLPRFTSQFKGANKIRKGSVIDLSSKPGHVLCTTIAGEEVGIIQSQPLCWSIFDLYIGEDPLDTNTKKDIELMLASLLRK